MATHQCMNSLNCFVYIDICHISFVHLCYIITVFLWICLPYIEELRYVGVIVVVLFLVVFLEFCCIVVPALLCRVSASMGMLLGLSEWRADGTTETRDGRIKGFSKKKKWRETKQNAKWNAGIDARRWWEDTQGGERETESKSSWRENITKSKSGKNKLKTKHCSSKASACMCVFTFSTSTLVA